MFSEIKGFPHVIAEVDGSLFPILKPAYGEAHYVCRKGFHSLNVQVYLLKLELKLCVCWGTAKSRTILLVLGYF